MSRRARIAVFCRKFQGFGDFWVFAGVRSRLGGCADGLFFAASRRWTGRIAGRYGLTSIGLSLNLSVAQSL